MTTDHTAPVLNDLTIDPAPGTIRVRCLTCGSELADPRVDRLQHHDDGSHTAIMRTQEDPR